MYSPSTQVMFAELQRGLNPRRLDVATVQKALALVKMPLTITFAQGQFTLAADVRDTEQLQALSTLCDCTREVQGFQRNGNTAYAAFTQEQLGQALNRYAGALDAGQMEQYDPYKTPLMYLDQFHALTAPSKSRA